MVTYARRRGTNNLSFSTLITFGSQLLALCSIWFKFLLIHCFLIKVPTSLLILPRKGGSKYPTVALAFMRQESKTIGGLGLVPGKFCRIASLDLREKPFLNVKMLPF